MYSFTDLKQYPNITILCECGRQFIYEEMYYCLGCKKVMCRVCTCLEINLYFCSNCSMMLYQKESSAQTRCSNCFQCPLCLAVLAIKQDPANK